MDQVGCQGQDSLNECGDYTAGTEDNSHVQPLAELALLSEAALTGGCEIGIAGATAKDNENPRIPYTDADSGQSLQQPAEHRLHELSGFISGFLSRYS
jgi:hypothetical protein